MTKKFGPMKGCTSIAVARSEKISPTGASLKKGFTELVTSSDSSASSWLGKAPTAAKAAACCSGAVSQAASFFASSTFSPCEGTAR